MPSSKQNKLLTAIKNQNPKEVQDALAKGGLDVNQSDLSGCTPLVKSINIGDSPEIIKHLLDAGAYASRAVGPDQTPPSLMAAIQNRPGVFKVLSEVLDPVLVVNKKGWTCLNAASHAGSLDIVKQILDADPPKDYLDAKNILGRTALHGAVIGQHKEVFDLLLKKKKPKIEIDEVDVNGATPLLLAAAYGSISMCKSLISKGADMTVTHKEGGNILHYVAANGHHEVLEFFMKQENCPSVDAVNDGRVTPLMMAVCHGYSDCVKVLLSYKAETNISMIEDGLAPLHVAARFHYEDIVRMLIHAGADPLAIDDRGQTPIDHANKRIVLAAPPEEKEPDEQKTNISRTSVDNLDPDVITIALQKSLGLNTAPSRPGNLSPRSAGRNKAITDLLEKEMTSKTNRYRGVDPKKHSKRSSTKKSKK